MSRTPFRTPDGRQLLANGPVQPLGFVSTIKGKIAELMKNVAGLEERLQWRYGEGVPASYIAAREWTPEASTFNLNILQTGNPADEQPVQYVLRDGQEYSLPIQLFGPGVFMLRYVHLSLWQRYHDPSYGWMRIPIPLGKSFFQLSPTGPSPGLQTLKWHIVSNLSGFGALCNDRVVGTNLFWNMEDANSGRRICDEWMPHTTLLPQHYQNLVDGDLSEFEVPWLFERESTVNFRFRLINPILQLAAGATVTPFQGRDDLVNGVRRMSVVARAEVHGVKFYSERDLLLREAV